jgi:DNA-binding SARP family transcriptional activator
VVPAAPKPRQVLALLAPRADRVVCAAALTQELWGITPPRGFRAALQTCVLQLRELAAAALEAGGAQGGARRSARGVLVTRPGGYLPAGGDGASDVREFGRLAGVGHRAADPGACRARHGI